MMDRQSSQDDVVVKGRLSRASPCTATCLRCLGQNTSLPRTLDQHTRAGPFCCILGNEILHTVTASSCFQWTDCANFQRYVSVTPDIQWREGDDCCRSDTGSSEFARCLLDDARQREQEHLPLPLSEFLFGVRRRLPKRIVVIVNSRSVQAHLQPT
ncbi:hypothetical protein EDC04DRAFT_2043706 [Pisolithus marmoratus]|nr:hypothetical protein EDC04DRAFT_2043706 [Pisolithus marmoratus]